MAITSKTEVANLALRRLGLYGSVEDIDDPTKDTEKKIAPFWELSRQMALKAVKPNFAISRRYLAVASTAPAFGYSYQYRYPSDCLAFLGIGKIEDKGIDYTIESYDGSLYIQTDAYSGEALPVRFVCDVSDVSRWTIEFVEVMSWFLAYNINMGITQDNNKQSYLEQIIDKKYRTSSALNTQENRPMRKNVSKFKQVRINGFYSDPSKK